MTNVLFDPNSRDHVGTCPRTDNSLYYFWGTWHYSYEIQELLVRCRAELEEAHQNGWNTETLSRHVTWLEDIVAHIQSLS